MASLCLMRWKRVEGGMRLSILYPFLSTVTLYVQHYIHLCLNKTVFQYSLQYYCDSCIYISVDMLAVVNLLLYSICIYLSVVSFLFIYKLSLLLLLFVFFIILMYSFLYLSIYLSNSFIIIYLFMNTIPFLLHS